MEINAKISFPHFDCVWTIKLWFWCLPHRRISLIPWLGLLIWIQKLRQSNFHPCVHLWINNSKRLILALYRTILFTNFINFSKRAKGKKFSNSSKIQSELNRLARSNWYLKGDLKRRARNHIRSLITIVKEGMDSEWMSRFCWWSCGLGYPSLSAFH